MMILSLLAGCWDFFKSPNEECTPEAVQKRDLVFFEYGQEAEAEACKKKLEAETKKSFIIEPHIKAFVVGSDPSGLDLDEYQDGFKVVAYKAILEGK